MILFFRRTPTFFPRHKVGIREAMSEFGKQSRSSRNKIGVRETNSEFGKQSWSSAKNNQLEKKIQNLVENGKK